MKLTNIWSEISSMLYWTMLAACTVGPGTVVTCARAGAEYGMSMIWALVFASILAYTLQEGTARLTIVSGKSLGQCLRMKYRNGAKIYDTAVICWMVGICVFFGNTLYECNNWAGGIDAILAIPGATDTTPVRVGCCVAYAVLVLALLYWDKVDSLGVVLGMMMMGMVCLFLVVVIIMGLDFAELGRGLIPNMPEKKSETSAEPADMILSLVGTTSIGFNLFLGGTMAKGKKLESSQRGIAFSTISALEVSVLILIVGAGTYNANHGEAFCILTLANFIKNFIGEIGVFVFSIGFIAAAISSMLAVPLGAGLTVESVFSESEGERDETCISDPAVQIGLINEKNITVDQLGDGTEAKMKDDETKQPLTGEPGEDKKLEMVEEGRKAKELPRFVYWGIISVMVVVATLVISLDAPRTHVILVAQVFNGCLLPFFAICLLVCLNDPQFMSSSPQPAWANCFLFTSVTITVFLASNVFLQKLFGHLLSGVWMKIGLAGGSAGLGMLALCIFTSLGSELVNSFRSSRGVQT